VRFFVAGTDTNVGKTEVAVALLRLMQARGHSPFAFKPFESGVTELSSPADALKLRRAAGDLQPLDTVSLYRFTQPLAPGIASRLERRPTRWSQVLRVYRRFAKRAGVIEGAGGLFVPLDERHDVIDLIDELQVPVVLVARAGLGTLNHTLLSLEALRARKLKVAAVVLNATSAVGDPSVPHNRAELQRRAPRLRLLGPTKFVKSEAARSEMLQRTLQALV